MRCSPGAARPLRGRDQGRPPDRPAQEPDRTGATRSSTSAETGRALARGEPRTTRPRPRGHRAHARSRRHLEEALEGPFPPWPSSARAGRRLRGLRRPVNATAAIRFGRPTSTASCSPAATPCSIRPPSTEFLPLCLERGVAVIAAGVFNSGVLADPTPGPGSTTRPPRRTSSEGRGPGRGVRAPWRPAEGGGVQFPLRHPAVACAIVGMRDAGEVDENLPAASATEIPDELWVEMREQGLLDDRAPLPGSQLGGGG